jgi:hypothetical protein
MFLCAAFVMALQGPASAQSDWLTYRHDFRRSGAQPAPAVGDSLSNYLFVRTLHCVWSFPADGQCGAAPPVAPAGPFWASPIVVQNIVFIGDTNGVFYALDAATGALKWRYPKTGSLAGSCTLGGNWTWGRYGIRSSASYANIGGEDAVISELRTLTPIPTGEREARGCLRCRSRRIRTTRSRSGKVMSSRTSIARRATLLLTGGSRILRL